jgi:hypothetical protein
MAGNKGEVMEDRGTTLEDKEMDLVARETMALEEEAMSEEGKEAVLRYQWENGDEVNKCRMETVEVVDEESLKEEEEGEEVVEGIELAKYV